MRNLRHLLIVVLCSGALAGLVLFAIQRFTIVPLIEQAERYEKDDDHHAAEWKPAEGFERTSWTLLTTILSSIGFAAVLFAFLALIGRDVTVRQGIGWGIAAFLCVHLAPALGLPPMPPGVPVADVQQRQLWWVATVIATAAGLWLMGSGPWIRRVAGAVVLVLPHAIGAPVAPGDSPLPPELMRNFVLASLGSAAIFWPLLGAIGGSLSARIPRS